MVDVRYHIFFTDGSQFSSIGLKELAKEWDFEQVTSSPEHPICDRMAESAAKVVKKIFRKEYQ